MTLVDIHESNTGGSTTLRRNFLHRGANGDTVRRDCDDFVFRPDHERRHDAALLLGDLHADDALATATLARELTNDLATDSSNVLAPANAALSATF